MIEYKTLEEINALLKKSLLDAVNEAEEWHDECRGYSGRLKELKNAYLLLDMYGLKTNYEK